MLNRVVLIGRTTKVPDLRYTQSGIAVCNFTLAVDRAYKNAQGEKETDFIDIQAWRQLAENCANYLDKGKLVAVDGSLQTGSYTAKDGGKRKTFFITAENVRFLFPKGDSQPPMDEAISDTDDEDRPF